MKTDIIEFIRRQGITDCIKLSGTLSDLQLLGNPDGFNDDKVYGKIYKYGNFQIHLTNDIIDSFYLYLYEDDPDIMLDDKVFDVNQSVESFLKLLKSKNISWIKDEKQSIDEQLTLVIDQRVSIIFDLELDRIDKIVIT